jgi:RNA polymerase primary sigma factor
MEIEINTLDAEQVVKEAEALVESTTNETALDAYFSILGNCPKITQREQIGLAAEYHSEVRECQEILNKVPGKVCYLIDILAQVKQGERLENFVVSDQEVRRQEFFEALQALSAFKNPDLACWKIRPMLLLNWSKEFIDRFHRLPQRPWIYLVTHANKQAVDDLARWSKAAEALEEIAILPINQIYFYVGELKKHAARAEYLFATLVEANLKLVVAMAKRFQNRGLDLDDLIQEGNLGLMKGIERYKASKGFNVSTYVVWWIRQSVAKALMSQGYVIRYPPAVHDLLRNIKKLKEELRKAGQPEPTVHELAKLLDTSPENIDAALSMFQVVSLNQTTGDGDETLENIIPGEEGISVREGEELREAIAKLLQHLKPTERRVLELRYGLTTNLMDNVNELGAVLRITRNHARQIEAKVLAKMRKSNKVQTQKARFR